MLIKKLVLCGYKRLLLNNIKYFELSPQHKLQMLLGSNGSGKSSVLKELSPLPAVPAEFTKDGYKVIEIVHNNNLYILTSSFSSAGNKFSIIKNDEELCNGTVSVYKEIVKREFGITNEIHELMVGSNSFHLLSVAERRSWFTKISDCDYSYAIQYYMRLKEQLRDIQGAIKLNQSRLVQESERLLTEAEQTRYREEIENLSKLTSMLLELKTPAINSRDTIRAQLNSYESQLVQMSKHLIAQRKNFLNLEGFTDANDIDLAIINQQANVNSLQNNIEFLCKEIERQQQAIELLRKANIDSVADIDKDIDALAQEADRLKQQLRYRLPFGDHKQALQALDTVYDNLITIFANLEPNGDSLYSRTAYETLLIRHNSNVEKARQLDEQQLQFLVKKKELEHLKDHSQIECPNCQYVWYRGYDEKTYQKLLVSIDSIAKQLIELKLQQTIDDEVLLKFNEQLELQRAYNSITRSWDSLKPLWSYLLDNNIVYDNPKQIPSILDGVRVDLELSIQIANLTSRLNECINIKNMVSKNRELDVDKLNNYIVELEGDLYLNNLKLKDSKMYLEKLLSYREVSIGMDTLRKQIEEILVQRDSKAEELIQSLRRDALNETISVIQLELNKKEQIIAKINIQKALVASIETQLIELKEKAEVLKLAVKELSPTEGLIAKGLTGFINHFVKQVNAFIKKVWLYPLELVPIAITEEDSLDLDYKFAVMINDNIPISDISKGSSAMKEIIDLAFLVVSMAHLGMSEYPLFLDELGASFDKAHRDNVRQLIQNITTYSNHSQVFIISHYEEMYGSFKETDITVLCSENIPQLRDSAFNKIAIIR